MAEILKIDRRIVAAGCCEVWEWADDEGVIDDEFNVTVTDVTRDALRDASRVTGRDVDIVDAMIACGWIVPLNSGSDVSVSWTFPKLAQYTGSSSKARTSHAARQKRYRLKKRHAGVTRDVSGDVLSDVSVTLPEEKRRECNSLLSSSPPSPPPGEHKFKLPKDWDTPEVQAQFNHWCRHVEASPKGRPILDWDLHANQSIQQGFRSVDELCKSIAYAISSGCVTLRAYIGDESRKADREARKPKQKPVFDDGLPILGKSKS